MWYSIITSEELRDTLYINRKPLSSICDQNGEGGGGIGYSLEKINERVLQIDMEIKNLEDLLEQRRSCLNVIRQKA